MHGILMPGRGDAEFNVWSVPPPAGVVPADVEVVCAPPFVFLDQARRNLKPQFKVAAQNCWTGKGGAFTGEVAADMLVDLDIPWVILGHSERRCGGAGAPAWLGNGHTVMGVPCCLGDCWYKSRGSCINSPIAHVCSNLQ
jgi:hypothetical protein